jgi:hypothetical protein
MSPSLRFSGARCNEGVVDTRVQVKNDMRGPRTSGRQVATAVRIINMDKPIQLASEGCAHEQVAFQRSV